MKKILLPLTALMLCMTACQKENDGILALKMEPYAGNAKLHLDNENYAVWDNGDSIWLNGIGKAVTISGSTATIEGGSATSYTAIYPYRWAGSGTISYPDTQTYRPNGIDAPMAAFCDAGEEVLAFRNLGSLLAVEVKNATAIDIDVISIVVTAADGTALNGTYAIDSEDYSLSTATAGSSTVTLFCPTAVTIAKEQSHTFYIALPPVSAKLTVQVIDDGYDPAISQSSVHTYVRSHGYKAPFHFGPKDNQLWYTAREQITPSTYLTTRFPLAATNGHTYRNGKGILTFPNKLSFIPERAFDNGATGLRSMTIPECVYSIEAFAFGSCQLLASIKLPADIGKIEKYTFYGCQLTSIDLPNVRSIDDWAFSGCDYLTSLNLPKVRTIGNGAFLSCTRLANVDMPEVQEIGRDAFQNCTSLDTIRLSWMSDLTIGNNAFLDCDLTDVYCYSKIPYRNFTPASLNISSTEGKTLHVPSGWGRSWSSWWGDGTVVEDSSLDNH